MTVVVASRFRVQADRIVRELRKGKKEFVITDRGRPLAIIIPMNKEELEDYTLATHPEFSEMRNRAREEIEAGEIVGLDEIESMK